MFENHFHYSTFTSASKSEQKPKPRKKWGRGEGVTNEKKGRRDKKKYTSTQNNERIDEQ